MSVKEDFYKQEAVFKSARAEKIGEGKYRIISPLRLASNKGIRAKQRFFHININNLISSNHGMVHAVKKQYYGIMHKQIESLPLFNRVEMEFTIYRGSKGVYDISNIAAATDKFFMDARAKEGKILDDSADYVTKVTYRAREVDRVLPRCEIIIQEAV